MKPRSGDKLSHTCILYHTLACKIYKISKGCQYILAALTLVCYEKFERIETSQLQNCFTKHDFFIEKA